MIDFFRLNISILLLCVADVDVSKLILVITIDCASDTVGCHPIVGVPLLVCINQLILSFIRFLKHTSTDLNAPAIHCDLASSTSACLLLLF